MGAKMNQNEERLQIEKDNYIATVKGKIVKADKVVIYGAGKIGNALFKVCTASGISIDAFCVKDKTTNCSVEQGIPVLQMDEMQFDRDKTIVLVGVKETGVSTIIPLLLSNGWNNYLETPPHALYFDNWMNSKKVRPVLEITPKMGCSVQCRYCPQEKLISKYYEGNKDRTTYMTFQKFKECIDKTPNDLILEFAGFVEPFLNEECVEMIQYAHENGRDITLFTTLVGLTKDKFDRIRNIPFKEVILHTPDEEEYAKIPMTRKYFEMLDMVLEAKKPNGKPFVDGANCQSVPHHKVLEHTSGKLKIYCELTDRAGNLDSSDNLASNHLEKRITCERAIDFNHNILLPDGSVVLCCMDFGMQHVLGNLLDQSYEEIMTSEETRYIKRCINFDFDKPVLCRQCNSAVDMEV